MRMAGTPLHTASLQPGAFAVTAFNPIDGWSSLDIRDAQLDQSGTALTVNLKERPPAGAATVQIIAFGTGPMPLLDRDLLPFAGGTGDPAAPDGRGNDFVQTIRL
jgi:hypothetical protein